VKASLAFFHTITLEQNMADPNSLGHFFENFTVSMVSVIVALIGFWTTFVKNLVSRKEVQEMIQNQSQYGRDREFIMDRLKDHKEDSATLFRALSKNTEVMSELKVQIALLSKTLEALEHRIER
jgi:septal ring factor EnvC (AmiA/AmiB activator)